MPVPAPRFGDIAHLGHIELLTPRPDASLAFFTSVVETTKNPEIRKMAEEFVEEEAEHVNLVHRLLRRYPEPPDSWSQDPDPPAAQE